MKQLVQHLKDGAMELLDVPVPHCGAGQLLVRVHHSAVSAGTEGKTVKDARAGYLAKARSRQEEVGKVLKAVKNQGLMPTLEMVKDRLEAPSPLGYSCSGCVVELGEDVTGFSVGDWVSCGGSQAAHGEMVSVPQNLCAKLKSDTHLKGAAFTTIGAIALQGVRRAELQAGEYAVVIGLGIVGQLTLQLLRIQGARVLGIDVDQGAVDRAREQGFQAHLRTDEALENLIGSFTRGAGVDSVIITAGTSSTDPVDLAGSLCRMRGRVVIVGNVPTGFKRKNYYRKELDLRMSMSYGPGRYDRNYEEKGKDYPAGWVRWTEQRNMQAIADWIEEELLNPLALITHEYTFEEAKKAYDMLMDAESKPCGILLNYETSRSVAPSIEMTHKSNASNQFPVLAMIGAGNFARRFLLPNLPESISKKTLVTTRANTAQYAGSKFGFEKASCQTADALEDPKVDLVMIATRHDSHGPLVLQALQQGKHVYVEKPLCLFPSELSAIREAYANSQTLLMVGFNRRFAPLSQKLVESLPVGLPRLIRYRVNSAPLASDHWAADPETGGGRIKGELCHFIDYCLFLSGGRINTISAFKLDGNANADDISVTITFSNGSLATIDYTSQGNADMPKENCEVFCGGISAVLDDFKTLTLYGKKTEIIRKRQQDKGHAAEVIALTDALTKGGSSPIAAQFLFDVTEATFAVLESIAQKGVPQQISKF